MWRERKERWNRRRRGNGEMDIKDEGRCVKVKSKQRGGKNATEW